MPFPLNARFFFLLNAEHGLVGYILWFDSLVLYRNQTPQYIIFTSFWILSFIFGKRFFFSSYQAASLRWWWFNFIVFNGFCSFRSNSCQLFFVLSFWFLVFLFLEMGNHNGSLVFDLFYVKDWNFARWVLIFMICND